MLSNQLKDLKNQRHLTNQQLSDLSGVPIGTINRILSGQTDNPSFQNVCDIVMAMEGSLDKLVGIPQEEHLQEPQTHSNMIALYEKVLAGKEKWLIRLFVCCCVLILFILSVLIYDMLNPTVGFFRG